VSVIIFLSGVGQRQEVINRLLAEVGNRELRTEINKTKHELRRQYIISNEVKAGGLALDGK
jgi:hypothetical protein